jgi:hypothetical protein
MRVGTNALRIAAMHRERGVMDCVTHVTRMKKSLTSERPSDNVAVIGEYKISAEKQLFFAAVSAAVAIS